jgi:Sortilin, neurotensin receptor 3,
MRTFCLLVFGYLFARASADPKVSSTRTDFDNLPSRIIYFEDTSVSSLALSLRWSLIGHAYAVKRQVVLYHDSVERQTWRSQDEGASWELLDSVPSGESWSVVEHPYDNRIVRSSPTLLLSVHVAYCGYQAFILSKSTTQYRTLDRGRTWQTFETPLPPALNSQPLAFHSRKDKWDWIMFTGQRCESLGGWLSKACQDEVS